MLRVDEGREVTGGGRGECRESGVQIASAGIFESLNSDGTGGRSAMVSFSSEHPLMAVPDATS